MLWTLVFFVLGISLLLLEFIMPGGICGGLGILMLIVSGGVGVYSYPDLWYLIVVGEIFGAAVSVCAGIYMLPRTRFASHMVLSATQNNEEGYVSDESRQEWLGALGKAYTPLRPSGTIVLRDERVGAVTNGDYIEEGTMVRVVEVHGNRVVVERAHEDAAMRA
ncbi:MAG: hypothetical protein AMXMBFR84_10050 [Candidatus Hydrogenedentota bacterium]